MHFKILMLFIVWCIGLCGAASAGESTLVCQVQAENGPGEGFSEFVFLVDQQKLIERSAANERQRYEMMINDNASYILGNPAEQVTERFDNLAVEHTTLHFSIYDHSDPKRSTLLHPDRMPVTLLRHFSIDRLTGQFSYSETATLRKASQMGGWIQTDDLEDRPFRTGKGLCQITQRAF